mgnify:CR=1 FL=1
MTPVFVRFAPPFSVYIIVYGPVPAVAVHGRLPVPVTQNGPAAVRLPCGNGLTVDVAEAPVKLLLYTQVVVA